MLWSLATVISNELKNAAGRWPQNLVLSWQLSLLSSAKRDSFLPQQAVLWSLMLVSISGKPSWLLWTHTWKKTMMLQPKVMWEVACASLSSGTRNFTTIPQQLAIKKKKTRKPQSHHKTIKIFDRRFESSLTLVLSQDLTRIKEEVKMWKIVTAWNHTLSRCGVSRDQTEW